MVFKVDLIIIGISQINDPLAALFLPFPIVKLLNDNNNKWIWWFQKANGLDMSPKNIVAKLYDLSVMKWVDVCMYKCINTRHWKY